MFANKLFINLMNIKCLVSNTKHEILCLTISRFNWLLRYDHQYDRFSNEVFYDTEILAHFKCIILIDIIMINYIILYIITFIVFKLISIIISINFFRCIYQLKKHQNPILKYCAGIITSHLHHTSSCCLHSENC